MCVSYRALNKITKPFKYPIGRCDDAVDDLGDGAGRKTAHMDIIRFESRQRIKKTWHFFSPDGKSTCILACHLDLPTPHRSIQL